MHEVGLTQILSKGIPPRIKIKKELLRPATTPRLHAGWHSNILLKEGIGSMVQVARVIK